MYKINKPSKTVVEIEFSTTKPEWEDAVKAVYEKTKGKYNVQGFRRGQAPRKLIEKTYGEGVFFEDTFYQIAEKAYADALMADESINPIGDPSVKLEQFVEGVLKGMIVLKVMPEVILGKYKGLNLEAAFMDYDEAMLDKELADAREHMSVAYDVTDRPSQMGDMVVLDFLGTLNGVPFDGGKAEDYELKLGSHSFIDNFEDQLVGHNVKDHVTVNVKFPDNYGSPELAGKQAVFECDIKAIKAFDIPELDDDFAKGMGEFDTLDEYKADVEAQIRHEIDSRNAVITEDAILDAIVDDSEIELPEEVINTQLDAVMKDLNNRLMYQGMSLEAYANYLGKTMEQLREQHRKDAEKIAKTKQVLEALVKAEKLSVSQAEVDAKLEEFAKISNKSLEDYKKIVEPRKLDYMYSDILMSKLMDFLKANNTVSPKSKDVKQKKSTTAKKVATTTKKAAPKATTKKPVEKAASTKKAAPKTAATKKPATKTDEKKTTKVATTKKATTKKEPTKKATTKTTKDKK